MAKLSDPAKFTAPPENVKASAFRVKLPYIPELTVKADHAYEAVEQYKKLCGIIDTKHEFDVTPIAD